MKPIKERAIRGDLDHALVKLKEQKMNMYKTESRMPNREERKTKCHHDLVIIPMGVAQVVMHNLHLHV